MEIGRRHGNRSSGKYRLKSTGQHRNGPGKQIVRILILKKNQYINCHFETVFSSPSV
jgi:hypothetical protein